MAVVGGDAGDGDFLRIESGKHHLYDPLRQLNLGIAVVSTGVDPVASKATKM